MYLDGCELAVEIYSVNTGLADQLLKFLEEIVVRVGV